MNLYKKILKVFPFGKLSIFDQLLIAVGILGVIVFAYIFLRQATYLTVTLKVGHEDVYYSIYSQGIPTWFENYYFKGMTEKNGLGNVQAEVLDINSFHERPQTMTVYLKTKLKVTYNRASDTYTYKGTPVVIGNKLKLYLSNVLTDGLVTQIDGIPDTREKKTVVVESKIIEENITYSETSGTKAYLADSIGVGEEIKDLNGNIIIKVLSKRVEPAKRVTTNASGGLLVQSDPIRKDVYLTLELNTTKLQNRHFVFDDIPVLVDQQLPLNTTTTLIYTTVTKILSIQ